MMGDLIGSSNVSNGIGGDANRRLSGLGGLVLIETRH